MSDSDSVPAAHRHFGDGVSLSELVRYLREGVYIMDASGAVVDANPVALGVFGIRSLDDARVPVRDRLRSAADWHSEMEALARDGAVREFTREIERADGSTRTVLDTCYARHDGGVVTYHGVIIDVSVVSPRDVTGNADAHTRDQGTGAYTADYLELLQTQLSSSPTQAIGVCIIQMDVDPDMADTVATTQLDHRLERMTRFLLRHIRASEVVVRAGHHRLVVVLPDADERGTETVGRRLQLAALRSAPSAFALGWASRRNAEQLGATIDRAVHDAVPVRVVERSFQPARH